MRTGQGFTLIELMIVVAIVGLLAAIAYPSYTAYVQRGNRAIAKTVLSEVAARQESYFTDRKSYATTLGSSGLGYPADTFYVHRNGNKVSSSTNAIYTITMTTNASATTFTLTATATGAQAADARCATLTLNNFGAKGATGGGTDCWSR